MNYTWFVMTSAVDAIKALCVHSSVSHTLATVSVDVKFLLIKEHRICLVHFCSYQQITTQSLDSLQ